MGLFPHYPASPGSISQAAHSAGAAAGKARGVGSALRSRNAVATGQVTGVLTGPTATVCTPAIDTSDQLDRSALVAQGCLNRWSQAVTDYNHGIDELNRRYAQAKATNFGVDADTYFCHGTAPIEQKQASYNHAVANADSALKAQLVAERAKLEKDLDAEASDVAGMLDQGPTDSVVMALIVGGYLPTSVAASFPGLDLATLNTLRKYVSLARSLWKTPAKVRKLINYFRTAKDLRSVAAELAASEKQWNAILNAMEATLDTKSLASLNTYMQAQQELSQLQFTKLFAEGEHIIASDSLLKAATVTGKFGGFLAVTGLVANGYDVYNLIDNWNQTSTSDKVLRIAGDSTGIVASAGGLALAAGVAFPPAGAAIIIGAGVVSAGIAVYQNWDEITHGVSVATDWLADTATDTFHKAEDAVEDFGNDIKDGAEKVWDDITPW